ncbi:hypothetical protein HFN72_35955 [Rhizobium laguerreae]|uniref:DUF6527 family protein n=1 Tax=Rhizobium laguerreae TaxID=1076926 RepID=UPI001C929DF4|nr:DUF6527 family protein [Rhizobium laguerreae]MBY3531240.1 hypothetical protein [Rhizobium laguerreae]
MKINHVRPLLVDKIPEKLDDGVIYVSERYRVALHNCCCGCGEEVSTPLSATEFSIRVYRSSVTVRPSIGNHDFACRSHYFITNGNIEWAAEMSRAQIDAGRAYDRRLKQAKKSHSGLGGLLDWIRKLFAAIFR